MEKQIKVLISSEEGEWTAGALEKFQQRGATAVLVGRDGNLVLKAIREEAPQIVIMELFMPNLDAIGVMRAAQKDPDLDRPVFAVVASYTTPLLEREVEPPASSFPPMEKMK